jgi:two-component system, OmpR family, response regulator
MPTPFVNTRPTALVVDANTAEREQIARCLQPFYRILKATGLVEATTQMRQMQPAVVVLDPDLPDGDGIEWLRYLRANPATRTLVVACVTHRSTIRDKVTGFLAGADDYVIYPIDPETFAYRLTLLTRIGRR